MSHVAGAIVQDSRTMSDEQVEVEFLNGQEEDDDEGDVDLDDSFDTGRMNAWDSVASELDFNNENASIGDSSQNENEQGVDMNHYVNLKELKQRKSSQLKQKRNYQQKSNNGERKGNKVSALEK